VRRKRASRFGSLRRAWWQNHASLLLAGANSPAVDSSKTDGMQRVKENLARVHLPAKIGCR